MLFKVSQLQSYTLTGTDGDIGRVKDVYFEDQNWSVRYLIADTGTWLSKRKVLLSPSAVAAVTDDRVTMNLTKHQIENSPSIDEDMPVSRQYETELHKHYNWPFYWQGPTMWGPAPRPGTSYSQVTGPLQETFPPSEPIGQKGDPHLRSAKAVSGYYIQAQDGEIGHVEDFLVDVDNWHIAYLVVDTRNWWPGKKVLTSPEWARSIQWDQSKIHLELDRGAIQSAPEYDPGKPVSRELEERLFQHYNRRPYWESRRAA